MNVEMLQAAYEIARKNYEDASHATFKALDLQFHSHGFDTIHNLAKQAVRLHIASTTLAERIWAKSIPYEKAQEILTNQFPDFPASTLQTALGNAYSDTR